MFVYLILINILAFLLYYYDKQKACKNAWRISEKTLLFVAFLGGSIGAYLAMTIFRHKTLHPQFYIGVPLMLAIQVLFIIYINF